MTYKKADIYDAPGRISSRMSTTEAASTGGYDRADGWLTDATLLKLWGVVVAAGWLVSQGVAVGGGVDRRFQLGLTAFWLIGSLVPITASFVWMRRGTFTGLFPVWTLLGVAGLLASFAVILDVIDVASVFVLGALWFAGPAVGFAVTTVYMNDWSVRVYAGATVANLVGAVAVVLVPGFEAVYFVVAAAIQGLPMLYHGVRLD